MFTSKSMDIHEKPLDDVPVNIENDDYKKPEPPEVSAPAPSPPIMGMDRWINFFKYLGECADRLKLLFCHNKLLRAKKLTKSQWTYMLLTVPRDFVVGGSSHAHQNVPMSSSTLATAALELYGQFLPELSIMVDQETSNAACYKLIKANVSNITGADLESVIANDWESVESWLQRGSSSGHIVRSFYTCLFSSLYSICRQGNGTFSTKRKLSEEVLKKLKLDINIHDEIVVHFYGRLKRFLTPLRVKHMLKMFELEIGCDYTSVMDLIESAKTIGLTNYYICENISRTVQNFPWEKVVAHVPDQFKAFQKARELIRGRDYYGYNCDLKDVVTPNYPDLAYICRRLEIDFIGNRRLESFVSNHGLRFKVLWDSLIKSFIAQQAHQKLSKKTSKKNFCCNDEFQQSQTSHKSDGEQPGTSDHDDSPLVHHRPRSQNDDDEE